MLSRRRGLKKFGKKSINRARQICCKRSKRFRSRKLIAARAICRRGRTSAAVCIATSLWRLRSLWRARWRDGIRRGGRHGKKLRVRDLHHSITEGRPVLRPPACSRTKDTGSTQRPTQRGRPYPPIGMQRLEEYRLRYVSVSPDVLKHGTIGAVSTAGHLRRLTYG